MIPIPAPVCPVCGRTGPDWSRPSNPDDEAVRNAVNARSCDICGAPKGQLCTNPIRPGQPLPGRIIHIGRTEPR